MLGQVGRYRLHWARIPRRNCYPVALDRGQRACADSTRGTTTTATRRLGEGLAI
jgi:hypothetical protein